MLRSAPVQERCDKEGGDDREVGEVDVNTRVRQRNELATDEYDGCKAAQREQGPSRDRGHTWMVRHPGFLYAVLLPRDAGWPTWRKRLGAPGNPKARANQAPIRWQYAPKQLVFSKNRWSCHRASATLPDATPTAPSGARHGVRKGC